MQPVVPPGGNRPSGATDRPAIATGDRGYDWVEGTCGADYLDGGNDDDQIIAAEEFWGNMDCPAAPDIINCGSGADGADVDALDVTKNCESVSGPL